jgi:hypothetical protein
MDADGAGQPFVVQRGQVAVQRRATVTHASPRRVRNADR